MRLLFPGPGEVLLGEHPFRSSAGDALCSSACTTRYCLISCRGWPTVENLVMSLALLGSTCTGATARLVTPTCHSCREPIRLQLADDNRCTYRRRTLSYLRLSQRFPARASGCNENGQPSINQSVGWSFSFDYQESPLATAAAIGNKYRQASR